MFLKHQEGSVLAPPVEDKLLLGHLSCHTAEFLASLLNTKRTSKGRLLEQQLTCKSGGTKGDSITAISQRHSRCGTLSEPGGTPACPASRPNNEAWLVTSSVPPCDVLPHANVAVLVNLAMLSCLETQFCLTLTMSSWSRTAACAGSCAMSCFYAGSQECTDGCTGMPTFVAVHVLQLRRQTRFQSLELESFVRSLPHAMTNGVHLRLQP